MPENDHIFFDIIKKNKNCEIHFFKGENEYLTSIFISRASSITLDLVIPSKMSWSTPGVISLFSLTKNKFMPLASLTFPLVFNKSASSNPLRTASVFASSH